MEVLIRMLIAVFVLIFGLARQPQAAPSPDENAFSRSVTLIENVTANVLPTDPAQIELNVTGYQPNGCEYPVLVDQQREGSRISVSIYRELPADIMCTAMLLDYNDTIHLDGTFAPGTYSVSVNDTQIEVTVPSP
ncbi:MAG: hypothetical protein GC204_14615 [Chloroflexi bacterium]|nr:hypothetical protein [Chloroflexota bacterium]